jgi:hypothetical protein
MYDSNERPGVDERYETAANASDLTVDALRTGPVDILIAAGLSPTVLGQALMRLHTDRVAKGDRRRHKPRSLELVMGELSAWGSTRGFDRDACARAVAYWVDPNCRKCDGRKRQTIKGTPVLSNKPCPSCQGSGNAHVPKGTAVLLAYMDDAVSRARQSIKKRLRPGV